MQPTADPHVFIEDRTVNPETGVQNYVRYRNSDGRRWEVHGECDRRGDCLIGANVVGYGTIHSHADIEDARQTLGRERIDSEIDVPVTPEFDLCCGADLFRYVELEPANDEALPT